MDIDRLFRTVFNNIVIRNKIFKLIRENNEFIGDQQCLVFKKYSKCNIKWCVKNKKFNLLVYKLSKEVKKRKEFTNDHYLYFLEHNSELELLKQIFQIYPNLIPTNENEQSVLIEKCSLGNSTLYIPLYGSYVETNYYYKFKNKQVIIKYLMEELKIKPTKQTLNNLCIDGENITMIKSLFDQGYYSITEDGDIGLLYCSLKAKDLQFYKLIIENNPILKNEFHKMDGNILNHLLASTCNVDFYKYSFDEILKDEDKIIVNNGTIPKSPSLPCLYREPILYHINQTVIKFGNMEIIEYLCNNFHLYPILNASLCKSKILTTISELNVEGDISPLKLLKFFINHPKIDFQTLHLKPAFKLFVKHNKMDCLIYLKQVCGDDIPIDGDVLCLVLSNTNSFKMESLDILNLLVGYNVGKTNVNCSVYEFKRITEAISKTLEPFQYKPILDPILKSSERTLTEYDLSPIFHSFAFDNIDRYEYLCSFIPQGCFKPSFVNKI